MFFPIVKIGLEGVVCQFLVASTYPVLLSVILLLAGLKEMNG